MSATMDTIATNESIALPEKKLARPSSAGRKKRKYLKVEYEIRTKLIVRVLFEKASIRKAAKEMGMNFSTAKAIIKIFKEEGRILKKAEQGDYGLGYHIFEKSVFKLYQQHQARIQTSKRMKAPEDQDAAIKAGKTIMEELARLKSDPNSVITIPQLAAQTPVIQAQVPSKVSFNNFYGFFPTNIQTTSPQGQQLPGQNVFSGLNGLLQALPMNQMSTKGFSNGISVSPQEILLREVMALNTLRQTLMNNFSALQSIQSQGMAKPMLPQGRLPSAHTILRPTVVAQSGAPSSCMGGFQLLKSPLPQAKAPEPLVKVQDQ